MHSATRREGLTTILVATDGSPTSRRAIDFALELAAEHQAEVVFAHVVPTLDLVADQVYDVDLALPHEPTENDRVLLDTALAAAAAHGVAATTALLVGSTAETLVAYGEERGVDLIVVGSHGHGALAGTLLGRVSRSVVHKSTRPVLVVRRGRSMVEATDTAAAEAAVQSPTERCSS